MRSRLTILAFAAAAVFAAAPALATPAKIFEYSQPGDLELNCHDISREISTMETLLQQARDMQDSSEMTATGVTVAKTVGSYLVGTLAGGIGILAAGYLVSEATDDKAEYATLIEDAAQQRRSFMAGIYNAKGCNGPLELNSIETASGEEAARGFRPVNEKRGFNE